MDEIAWSVLESHSYILFEARQNPEPLYKVAATFGAGGLPAHLVLNFTTYDLLTKVEYGTSGWGLLHVPRAGGPPRPLQWSGFLGASNGPRFMEFRKLHPADGVPQQPCDSIPRCKAFHAASSVTKSGATSHPSVPPTSDV